MTLLTETQEILLGLLSQALFGHTYRLPESVDYAALYTESIQQAVQPLIFSVLVVPKAQKEIWERTFNQIVANNMSVDYEYMEVDKLLQGNSNPADNIPYVAIKGSVSASYYPEPILRAMGDVDFIIYKKDLNRAGNLLNQKGFVWKKDDEHEAHRVYQRDWSSAWEMHWCLSRIPQSSSGDKARLYFSNIIDTAITVTSSEGAYRVPDRFHHGLVLLIHTAGHMINTGIGLRHLCDWAVFVNSVDNFEDMFKDKLEECGLWRFAQLMTQLSEIYLHLPRKEWAYMNEIGQKEEINYELLNSIICDIFAGGNFGQKDSERINQAKLLTDKGKGCVDDTSFFKQLVAVMNEKAKIAMPMCRRFPLLLPIGWIYVGTRHLVRIKEGKRPEIHFNKMVDGARKRQKIYKEFRLYEK